MQRELVARLVPRPDAERVFAKADALYRLAASRAVSLGPSAICAAPACVGLAAAVLRVPCDLRQQAAAACVSEPAFLKARNTLARVLGVRVNLSAAELARAAGCEPALEAAAVELVGAFAAKDRHASATHEADALLGGALLAAGAKQRSRLDKGKVARAAGCELPVLLALASRMRAACPELVGLVGTSAAGARKRAREAGDAPRGHELDLEAAEAVPSLSGSAVVKERREYEAWRARVVGARAAGGAGRDEWAAATDGPSPARAAGAEAQGPRPALKQKQAPLAAFFAQKAAR